MEVLPCSGARHGGKSDCSKQELETFKHDGISNCLQGGSTGDTYYGFEIDDGQNLSSYSHDSEDENVETEDHFAEPCRLPNNDLEVSSCTGITCLEQDIPQAVWVKFQERPPDTELPEVDEDEKIRMKGNLPILMLMMTLKVTLG
ncbi:hypothetical protein ACS0TY_027490 [Phlomoides rotata]